MKENDKTKALDDIRTALAKYIHDYWSDIMKDIYKNSRQNKGGSITIPKNLVENIESKKNTDFFDLSKDAKKEVYDKAEKIMSIIRLIITTKE